MQNDSPIIINGVKIRKLRDMYKLSQFQLACEIGIERLTLRKIECEKGGCNLCTAYKLAKYFNVSIESLIE